MFGIGGIDNLKPGDDSHEQVADTEGPGDNEIPRELENQVLPEGTEIVPDEIDARPNVEQPVDAPLVDDPMEDIPDETTPEEAPVVAPVEPQPVEPQPVTPNE